MTPGVLCWPYGQTLGHGWIAAADQRLADWAARST
jgi:hypothetical protein